MSDRADQKAPQASQFRLARRRPEFFGQAHERRDLLQLPCSPRSGLAHAALNSAAAQPPVAHELVKEQACFSQAACFRFFACFFFGEEGKGAGGARKEAMRWEQERVRFLPRGPRGNRAGRCPPCPNGAPLEFFGGVARREEAARASRWGLGSENRPSRQWALNMGPPWPGI